MSFGRYLIGDGISSKGVYERTAQALPMSDPFDGDCCFADGSVLSPDTLRNAVAWVLNDAESRRLWTDANVAALTTGACGYVGLRWPASIVCRLGRSLWVGLGTWEMLVRIKLFVEVVISSVNFFCISIKNLQETARHGLANAHGSSIYPLETLPTLIPSKRHSLQSFSTKTAQKTALPRMFCGTFG